MPLYIAKVSRNFIFFIYLKNRLIMFSSAEDMLLAGAGGSSELPPFYSISIICKNEEDSFPNLHASLKEHIAAGGEVVVVDTGSTDKTIEVLKSLGYSDVKHCGKPTKLRYEEVGSRFVIDLSNTLDEINEKFIDKRD